MGKHSFFAFVNRMRYINRWGLMRNTQTENLQEHSMQVAMIAHALAVFRKKYFPEAAQIDENKVAVIAMYHDAGEIITGDMPTPIKYANNEIKKAYKEVEALAEAKLLDMLPRELKDVYLPILSHTEENAEEWKLVKAADRISAYIKCLEEEKAGNSEFKSAGASILQTIVDLHIPEVDMFIENYISAYSLSLDELQK